MKRTLQRTLQSLALGLAACGAVFAQAGRSRAAEVSVLSSAETKPLIDALGPQFECATGLSQSQRDAMIAHSMMAGRCWLAVWLCGALFAAIACLPVGPWW